eukprot:superscaffoldBa00012771_g25772
MVLASVLTSPPSLNTLRFLSHHHQQEWGGPGRGTRRPLSPPVAPPVQISPGQGPPYVHTRSKTQAVPYPTDPERDEEQEMGGIFPMVEGVLPPNDRDANNVILQT